MKNVIGYIRVSTDGQCGDDKYGLDVQREQIVEALRRNNYRRKDAARDLFISERTLYRRMKALGIDDNTK